MKLLGLTGAAKSGKSTAARYLRDTYNYVELSFATPIKEAVKVMFDVSDVQLQYRKEEEVEPFDKSLRYLLQTLGTEWGRNLVDEEIWVKLLAKRVAEWQENGRPVVISDVRFENEANWIRQNGGTLIHIKRKIEEKVIDHTSEWGVSEMGQDRILHNDQGIGHLHAKLAHLLAL